MRLIDADALRDEIAVLFERNPKLIDGWLAYAVEDTIDDAPAIDLVKHGRWETEVRTIQGHKIPFFACSNCGKNAVEEYRYCPICGARMMEGRADDER